MVQPGMVWYEHRLGAHGWPRDKYYVNSALLPPSPSPLCSVRARLWPIEHQFPSRSPHSRGPGTAAALSRRGGVPAR